MATEHLHIVPDEPHLLSITALMEELIQDAESSYRALESGAGVIPGPAIPFPRLSETLGGYWSPGLHVIHGQPGIGKTALALQLASSAGCPALYVTAEMSPLELARRIIARQSGQFLGRFRGELPPNQVAGYAAAVVEKIKFPAVLDTTRSYAPLN